MGYTTSFEGSFEITPPLSDAHRDELRAFAAVSHPREGGAPGGWCQWVPSDNGRWLAWDEQEKFYDYVEWLEHLLRAFLVPWGHRLTGEVRWAGEEPEDVGRIVARGDAIEAIAEEGEAFDPVADALADLEDDDWKRRVDAVKTLLALGRELPELLEEAFAMLDDREPRVRRTVANLLGDLGAPARPALPRLLALLRDPDDTVKQWAAYALGRIGGGAEAIAALRAVAAAPGSLLAKYVAEAIERCGMLAR